MVARSFSFQEIAYSRLLQVPDEREFMNLEELKPHQLTELGLITAPNTINSHASGEDQMLTGSSGLLHHHNSSPQPQCSNNIAIKGSPATITDYNNRSGNEQTYYDLNTHRHIEWVNLKVLRNYFKLTIIVLDKVWFSHIYFLSPVIAIQIVPHTMKKFPPINRHVIDYNHHSMISKMIRRKCNHHYSRHLICAIQENEKISIRKYFFLLLYIIWASVRRSCFNSIWRLDKFRPEW